MSGSRQSPSSERVRGIIDQAHVIIEFIKENGAHKYYSTFFQVKVGSRSIECASKGEASIRLRHVFKNNYTSRVWPLSPNIRKILAPNEHLLEIQRILAQELTFPIHPCATGYIPQKSILHNALQHAAANHILNVDFKNFFPSIKCELLRSLFCQHGLSEEAEALLLLTTYKGSLPTGAATSPILSNAVCFELDRELCEAARSAGMRYTRYVDDITFSSLEYIDAGVVDVIAGIAAKYGLKLNQTKTRFISRRRALKVTGLVLNHDPSVHQYVPRVPRRTMRKIRAMIHRQTNDTVGWGMWNTSLESEKRDARINGYEAWVKGINPEQGKKIEKWRRDAQQASVGFNNQLDDSGDDLSF
jgi:RNA-directed DNA polymerase